MLVISLFQISEQVRAFEEVQNPEGGSLYQCFLKVETKFRIRYVLTENAFRAKLRAQKIGDMSTSGAIWENFQNDLVYDGFRKLFD